MQDGSNTAGIILASQSPRREYLLTQAGLHFEVVPSNVDESGVRTTAPADYARVLAEMKARQVAERFPDSWVIGADTIVLIGDTILGKPADGVEAREMLQRLSGQTHAVLTGYAVCCKNKAHFFSDVARTEVVFKILTEAEIDWYIDTREPFDKAGAYAIQGIGTFLVQRINGSYTNVVGLPVCEVVEHLIRQGVMRRDPSDLKDLRE